MLVILIHRGWGPKEWDSSYLDLPNRLVKVLVKDRNAFKTEDAERKLVSPRGCQEKIDEEVRKYDGGRAFVRPSGTEDCVRSVRVDAWARQILSNECRKKDMHEMVMRMIKKEKRLQSR